MRNRQASVRGSTRKREIDIRIQRAVVGFQIPMTAIVKLYGAMEAAALAGASDVELRELVALTPGVTVAS